LSIAKAAKSRLCGSLVRKLLKSNLRTKKGGFWRLFLVPEKPPSRLI